MLAPNSCFNPLCGRTLTCRTSNLILRLCGTSLCGTLWCGTLLCGTSLCGTGTSLCSRTLTCRTSNLILAGCVVHHCVVNHCVVHHCVVHHCRVSTLTCRTSNLILRSARCLNLCNSVRCLMFIVWYKVWIRVESFG